MIERINALRCDDDRDGDVANLNGASIRAAARHHCVCQVKCADSLWPKRKCVCASEWTELANNFHVHVTGKWVQKPRRDNLYANGKKKLIFSHSFHNFSFSFRLCIYYDFKMFDGELCASVSGIGFLIKNHIIISMPFRRKWLFRWYFVSQVIDCMGVCPIFTRSEWEMHPQNAENLLYPLRWQHIRHGWMSAAACIRSRSCKTKKANAPSEWWCACACPNRWTFVRRVHVTIRWHTYVYRSAMPTIRFKSVQMCSGHSRVFTIWNF